MEMSAVECPIPTLKVISMPKTKLKSLKRLYLARLIAIKSLNENVDPINPGKYGIGSKDLTSSVLMRTILQAVLPTTTYNALKAELGLPANVILLAQRQPQHGLAPNPFWTFPQDNEVIPEEIDALYRVGVQEERYYIALIRTPDNDFPALIRTFCSILSPLLFWKFHLVHTV